MLTLDTSCNTLPFQVIESVAWCPNSHLSVVAVSVENRVILINAGVGDKMVVEQTRELVAEPPADTNYVAPDRVKAAVTWQTVTDCEEEASSDLTLPPEDVLVVLKLFKPVKQVIWHGKGDYFSTVLPQVQRKEFLN